MLTEAKNIEDNISIIMQGPVTTENISLVANHCHHWRTIIPHSEIILSISTTDLLSFKYFSSTYYKEKYSNIVRNALNLINISCNHIVYNEYSIATPLPPIKNNVNLPNNINFLIDSSLNGLRAASKKYCLRIRNDAIFLDTDFIKYYCCEEKLPRKEETSVFKKRIMVPWCYTINPFAQERLPLHISDWLNFGLTEDILKMWDIPFYSYADSIYFQINENKSANFAEKKFLTRLAVEQHLAYSFFKKHIPSLKLDYLNDLQSRNLSIDIIIDNFFIFSKKEHKFIIRKDHQKEFYNNYQRSHCITEEAWKFMAENRHIDYNKILSGSVDENITKISNGLFSVEKFPEYISPLHNENNFKQRIIFSFFSKILSHNMKNKFFLSPEKFFPDSKFSLVRRIGKYYLSKGEI